MVATCDLDENTTNSRVWLDGAPVTAGPYDGQPRWSHDGRWLAFTSRRGEKKGDATLHVMPTVGPGEVRTICTLPEAITNVAWSPDGRHLAFVSRTRDERYDAKDESWQAPRKIERYASRLNGENWVFDRPAHVYVVSADGTGAPRNLTPGEFQHSDVSWLPDSSGVVTVAVAPRHLGPRPRGRPVPRRARRVGHGPHSPDGQVPSPVGFPRRHSRRVHRKRRPAHLPAERQGRIGADRRRRAPLDQRRTRSHVPVDELR